MTFLDRMFGSKPLMLTWSWALGTGYNKKMERYRYFSESEVAGLAPQFAHQLDQAREIAGVPFVFTRTVSTAAENAAVGGVQESAHIRGFAADIACSDSQSRFKIVKGLLSAGICRIGVYDRHIHADADEQKPQCVIWSGVSH